APRRHSLFPGPVVHRMSFRQLHRLLLSLLALGSAALGATASADPALTLDDAVRLALENNQNLKVSAFAPLIASANLLTQYGRFDPALTFNRSVAQSETPGTYSSMTLPLTKTDNYGVTVNGQAPWGLSYSVGASAENYRGTFNGFADSFSTFGGLSVTQPLMRNFGFGANLQGLRVARANRGISEWQHRQNVIDLVTLVIDVFNNLQEARDNLRIAHLSRDLANRLYEENKLRRKVGAISDADVTQAQATVANREEAILLAARSVYDIENQLRELIGRTDYTTSGPGLPIVALPPAASATVEPARDYRVALDLRPDYQAARLGLKVQRANESYARNQVLPQLDFVGSYGYLGYDRSFSVARAQVRDRDAKSYSAGLVFSVPFTFADSRGRARAARLSRLQAEADLIRLERDIAVAIATAAGQIETTQQRVAATQTALDLAQQALDAEQKRFKAGTSTTYLVLQQQELLANAQNSNVRALADQRRALAAYQRTTGTTLQVHQITVPSE
ncbi:MAG: TolC family protein, partial [Opitutales bacterium]